MYRSASSGRVSDEFLMNPSPSSSSPPRTRASLGNGGSAAEEEQLPTYDPQSHVARKERSRLRSAENAIHLIPLLLIFCAVVLWFFSHPAPSFAQQCIARDLPREGDHNEDEI